MSKVDYEAEQRDVINNIHDIIDEHDDNSDDEEEDDDDDEEDDEDDEQYAHGWKIPGYAPIK